MVWIWTLILHLPLPSYGELFLSLLAFVWPQRCYIAFWCGCVQSMQLTNFGKQFGPSTLLACWLCRKQIHFESRPRVKFQAILAPTAVQAEFCYKYPWFIIMAPHCGQRAKTVEKTKTEPQMPDTNTCLQPKSPWYSARAFVSLSWQH